MKIHKANCFCCRHDAILNEALELIKAVCRAVRLLRSHVRGSLCRPPHPRIWTLGGPLSGHQILDVDPKPAPISGPPPRVPTSSHNLFPLTPHRTSLCLLPGLLPPILSLPIHSPQRAPKTQSGSLLSIFSRLTRFPLPGSAETSSPLTSRLGRAALRLPGSPMRALTSHANVHFPAWTGSSGRTGPGLSWSSLRPQHEQVRVLMRQRETENE